MNHSTSVLLTPTCARRNSQWLYHETTFGKLQDMYRGAGENYDFKTFSNLFLIELFSPATLLSSMLTLSTCLSQALVSLHERYPMFFFVTLTICLQRFMM